MSQIPNKPHSWSLMQNQQQKIVNFLVIYMIDALKN